MLYDEEVYENFKNELNAMGYDKVFKISAATNEGVDELMKAAAEMLNTIPVKELEIADEDKIYPRREEIYL